ncbi:MAG: alpha/beta hydrolase [Bacteroidetes bacterium]|nr:alpha/beta hydrolase [Bacteroidota bacterium]
MMQTVPFKYGKISYQVKGKGRAIVLLHGFLESSQIWSEYAERLSKVYKVILIDLPGHGESECFGYVHRMELMAQSVKAVLDSLHLRRYILVGHSMGGYVALAFAELYSDNLKGMVLFHSTALPDSKEKKRDREKAIEFVKKNPKVYAQEATKKLFAPLNVDLFRNKVELAQSISVRTSQQGIIAALEGMKVRKNREVVLKFARYPVLFIAGKLDTTIPFERIKPLFSLAKNTYTQTLENAGHMGFFEAETETLRATKKFARVCFRTPY